MRYVMCSVLQQHLDGGSSLRECQHSIERSEVACGEGRGRVRFALQDEESCIGCTMCASIAPGTFRMEKDHGRSRVFAQWANTDDETQVRSPPAAAAAVPADGAR